MTVTVRDSKPKIVPLGDLVTDVKPGFAVGERDPSGVVQVRMNNVDTAGNLDLENVIRVPATDRQIADCSLTVGDVLFNNTNSTELVGKSAVFRGHTEPVTFSNHFTRLRVDPKKLDPFYLGRWLTRQQQCRVFEGLCTRWVGQSAVRTEKLLALSIPLPSLPEQKRIAEILDKADAIRRKRDGASRLTRDLLLSTFVQMFGNPVQNSKGYATQPLEVVAKVNRGKFTPRPRNDPRFYNGEYPFIQTGDIAESDSIVRKWTQTLNEEGIAVSGAFDPGTVVIAIVGATIGETAILAFRSYAPDSVIGIEPDPNVCTSEYIECLLRWWKPIFRQKAPETARANINLETLRPLPIPMAPIEIQRRFSHVYQRAVALPEKMSRSVDDLFNSLVQRAFRGGL
jgi:type I restriction enzyme S subunit